jgi:TonB-dependent starch-binding outer membrane protein SusC
LFYFFRNKKIDAMNKNSTRKIKFMQAVSLMLGLFIAHVSYAQLLDKPITISVSNASLEKALHELETVAKVKFVFSADLLDLKEVVSIDAKSLPLRKVLDELLTPRQISFIVHETSSAITLKKQSDKRNDERSFLQSGTNGHGKDSVSPLPVTGKVIDTSNQQPMAGVNVLLKGTTNGTTTDSEGKFTVQAKEGDVLVFSFIGYVSQEVRVDNQTVMEISLVEDIKSLGEVVVNAGYYEIKEKEQTGNIAKLTSQEIEKQPVNNPLQALQGKMAGVYIQQQSGVPGGSFNIQIRGQNSLRNTFANNGNRPLYIVDGVPFTSTPLGTSNSGAIIDGGNPLNNINPSDIESIEILKDADATAIYGSRGANGVVLITTKKGKEGKTQFNVNVYHGIGKVASKMDLLNTQQYLEMRKEAFVNDKVAPGTYFPDHDLLSWEQNRNTDWQKVLLGGTSTITNARLSVSGGNANTQFLVVAGYFRESSVFPGDFADKKLSTHFNISHSSSNNKLKLDFSGYYLIDDNNLLRVDLTSRALTLAPNAPEPYNADGTLNWASSTWANPMAALKQEFNARTTTLVNNTILSYKIAKGLQAKVNLGYTEIRFNEFTSQPRASYDPSRATASSSTFADKKTNTWISEPQLEYKVDIGQGTFTALVGSTFQGSNTEEESFQATGFNSDALLRNIQAASSVTVLSTDAIQYRYSALFGRVNYNWSGKYILNLTGRRDGSSRFGPGKQFANFGAIGAAWIFTQEKFMQIPYLSFGKLRMSYGTTGNDQIGDYGYLDLWNTTSYSYDGRQGLYPRNLANSNYAWEVNKKLEVGLEFGLLKDKLNFSFSYYRNHSGNQLVGVPLPAITGFGSVQANFSAEVENTGLEINSTLQNIKTKSFTWTTSLNITFPRNELLSFLDLKNSSFAFDYVVGKPLSVVPAFHSTGVDPQTGLYTHEDVNKDGTLTPENDYQGRKVVAQNYFGGFQNTFTYKGISLDVFFQFVEQTGRNYLTIFNDSPGSASNQPTFVLDRWQKPGDHATVQQYTQGFGDAFLSNLYNGFSDNRISDASFIRLRNVSLSYKFPTNWLSKARLQQASIYLQGQNLWTFTNYLGLDPESQSASLPPLRRITIGFQVTF